MSHTLFNTVQKLHDNLQNNIDIHTTQQELEHIVLLGRQNDKLRIITQFLAIMEALARNYEYENAEIISEVKVILKNALNLIIQMVDGNFSNIDGAYKMEHLIREAKNLLIKKLDKVFYDEKLLIQLAYDIQKDSESIKDLFKTKILVNNTKQYYDTLIYYLQKLQESVAFMGINSLEDFIQSISVLASTEYNNHHFSELGSHADFLLAVEFLEKTARFINESYQDKNKITEYFSQKAPVLLNKRLNTSSYEHKNREKTDQQSVVLSEEEISALMDDNYSIEMVSFDTEEPENLQVVPKPLEENTSPVSISPEEYQKLMKDSIKAKPVESKIILQEDIIKYLGRFFQKQEIIIEALSEDKKVELSDDIKEINSLINNIKTNAFANYYTSVEKSFSKELREFIYSEVKSLGKKIRLGIRGEKSEFLLQDKELIKDIVFTLVKNSLHHGIEPVFRRRATDKNETAWLLIEFEDIGNTFDIYIRDDGRGVVPEMNLPTLEEKIVNRGGSIDIDAMESEYLKIHIQLPMKRVFVNGLVVQLGNMSVIIPDRCVYRVVSVNEAFQFQKDEHCLGQVNLSTLLGLEHSPVNMVVVCEFGMYKVLIGVDRVLYNVEAFVEDVDVPLISGSDTVSILKDGSISFILNERKIYQMAKSLILSREQKI